MGKTWLHVPIWIKDLRLDKSSVNVAIHIFWLSFFNNKTNQHSPVEYKPTEWANELGVSKATVINSVKKLVQFGYLVKDNSYMIPVETPGIIPEQCEVIALQPEEPLGIEIIPKVDDGIKPIPSVEKIIPENEKLIPSGIKPIPTTLVYDSLTQGFETLLVFKQYLYSINIVVGADDLIKILGNIQNVEILKIMRKKSIDKELQGFEKNAAFQQCVEWIREIYKEEEKPGEELPVDRYLLYLLIQSIENDRNPAGKFITAVKKLKTDGTRFDLDMSEYKKVQQTQNDNEIMERRISSTQTMLRHQDRDRAKALADEARKLELFESRPDLVEALMPAARERAEKELEPLFGTRMDKKTGEDLSPQRELTRQLLTAVKLRALIEEQLEIEKKGKTG